MLTHSTEQNALHLFEQQCNYENAAEECLNYIHENVDKLILNKSLYAISEELLIRILCTDSLNIYELYLFKFVLKWSEKGSIQVDDVTIRKKKYFTIFQLIRFPTMSASDFFLSF